MQNSFYIKNLSEADFTELNKCIKEGTIPNWDNYKSKIDPQLLEKLIESFPKMIEEARAKAPLINRTGLKPPPQKAPPPRFIRINNQIIPIPNAHSFNSALVRNDCFEYNVHVENNTPNITIICTLPGYIIEDAIEEDILYDATNINSPNSIDNLLIRLKIIQGPINPQPSYSSINFDLSKNPTKVTIVPTDSNNTILSYILGGYSFHCNSFY